MSAAAAAAAAVPAAAAPPPPPPVPLAALTLHPLLQLWVARLQGKTLREREGAISWFKLPSHDNANANAIGSSGSSRH